MALTIPIAHDFICPWCWIGLIQARRLQKEHGVALEWVGYELWPDALEWPEASAPVVPPANKPAVPSRLDFLLALEGISIPALTRPKRMRTHNAHEAVEYAKTEGFAEEMIDALYHAYWLEGLEINDLKVIKKISKRIVKDVDALVKAVEKRKFRKHIVGFDDDAYASGVYNVPTFFIGEDRFAEQPYSVLSEAVVRLASKEESLRIYTDLHFPAASLDRPYTFINMVATIDGKIITGNRDEHISDLGSDMDHELMRKIEAAADAVLIGAGTLRASGGWNPKTKRRIVVSRSGDVPYDMPFLSSGESYLVTRDAAQIKSTGKAQLIVSGQNEVDFTFLQRQLKSLGVQRLLVMGGSEINAEFFKHDLIDEIFLTIAPKIKLGADTPTLADGEALPREMLKLFSLVEHHVVGDEVFLRYRRERN